MKRRRLLNLVVLFLVMAFTVFILKFIIVGAEGFYLVLYILPSLFLSLYNILSYVLFWQTPDSILVKQKDARVIAVIPSYNESEIAIQDTVESLLNQSFEISEIHVVDDGSAEAIKPYKHEKVVWHRQANKGKRFAQQRALESVNRDDFDFVLTIDSDSRIDHLAVEKMLYAFECDDKLYGCTGFVVAKNYNQSIITRLSDLNVGISCILTRPSHSFTGSIETTSGALSMYKKECVFDNLDHYVSTGTFSDDRQLCLYALLHGKVIGVNEALAYTQMPITARELVNQRIRWGKGSWKYFPFQITNLKLVHLMFPLVGIIQWLLLPLFWFIVLYELIALGSLYTLTVFLIVRVPIRYFQAILYLWSTEHMGNKEKIFTLIFITPLDFLYVMLVNPILKYYSLFSIRNSSWLTRK